MNFFSRFMVPRQILLAHQGLWPSLRSSPTPETSPGPPSPDTVRSLIHAMFLPSAHSGQLRLLINFPPVTRGARARRAEALGWPDRTCVQFPGKLGGRTPKPARVPRITSAERPSGRCGSPSAKCRDAWAARENINTRSRGSVHGMIPLP